MEGPDWPKASQRFVLPLVCVWDTDISQILSCSQPLPFFDPHLDQAINTCQDIAHLSGPLIALHLNICAPSSCWMCVPLEPYNPWTYAYLHGLMVQAPSSCWVDSVLPPGFFPLSCFQKILARLPPTQCHLHWFYDLLGVCCALGLWVGSEG